MRDTKITCDAMPEWQQRSRMQINTEELNAHTKRIAQLVFAQRPWRDAVTVTMQNGGRTKMMTFTRAALREQHGYRAFYFWE